MEDTGEYASYDDLLKQGGQPQSSDADDGETASYDELIAQGGKPAEGPFASAARGFAHEAIPAAVGGAVGLGAGVLTAPFLGGIPGGLAAGAAASYATRSFEDWLLEKLGFDDSKQQEANRAEHPVATAAGELGTALIPFGVGSKLAVGQRLLGAGIQAGVETGSEAAQGNGFDPVQIALAGGVGAVANRPRSGTMAAASRIPGVKGKLDAMMPKPPAEPPATGAPTGEPTPAPKEPGGATNLDDVPLDMKTVTEQIKLYGDDPVLGPYWRDYKAHMEQAPDKGNAGLAQEASQGKGPQFTPQQADAANDVTTVAKGVAAENPPPRLDPAIGNQESAPMQQTIAARPSAPTRDYRKNKPGIPAGHTELQPSEAVSTGHIAPDIAAVMKRDQPQTTFEQQTVQPPNQPPQQPAQQPPQQQAAGGAPQGMDLQKTVRQAMQLAMRRPIQVVDALPEGGNSSKDLNGPVLVHRAIPPQAHRFIAVHETVEGALMAKGVSYDMAHKIATEAEKNAVMKAGINWDTYTHKVDHATEQAAKGPASPAGMDANKHVSTAEAMEGDKVFNPQAPSGPTMEQINQRVASIPGMQTRPNGLSAKSAQPLDQIGRGPVAKPPVTAPVTEPKAAKPARKGLDEYTPEDMAAKLRENPAEFKQILEQSPGTVRDVMARNPALMEQVIEDHPALAEHLRPMKKAIREKEKYDAGEKRLGKRGAKYEAVGTSVKTAVDEVTPHWMAQDEDGDFNAGRVEGLAKQLWERLTGGKAGANPFKGDAGYKPQKLYTMDKMHFGVAVAAKDVVDKPSEKSINTFDSWIRAYANKDENAAEALQTERKHAADIARDTSERAPLHEANLEAVLDEGAREPFELLEKGKKVLDHNALREYVNDLSDEDYNKLKLYDDELEKTVLGTKNPSLVQEAYKRYLAPEVEAPKTFQGKRVLEAVERPAPQVAGFDAVSPEETKGVRTPVKTAADIPKGHTVLSDFLSDESGSVPRPGKKARAAALSEQELRRMPLGSLQDVAQTLGVSGRGTHDELVPMIQRAQQRESGSIPSAKQIQEQNRLNTERRYLNDQELEQAAREERPVLDKFKDFLKDESGAVHLPAFLQSGVNRLFSRTPTNNPVHDLLAEAFRGKFHGMDSHITQVQSELHAHLMAAPKESNTFWRGMFNSYESKQAFTPHEQQVWDQWVNPLLDRYNRAMDAWRAIDPDIPAKFAGVEANHLPRLLLKSLAKQNLNDTPWLRSLDDWNPATQDRKWFTLSDGQGMRLLVEHKETGDWHVVGPQGGHGQNITNNLPPSWKGHPGDTVSFTRGGQPHNFTLDHAKVNEITRAIPGMEYVKNPMFAFANAIAHAETAMLKNRLFNDIKTNPDFMQAITTSKEEARNRGYRLEPTKLKDFAMQGMGGPNPKPIYMPDAIRWVMDDMARPGYEGENLNKLGSFATAAARPLYFMSPVFHPLNVADNWLHAMGGSLMKGKAPLTAQEAMNAIQSVHTQDQWQKRWRDAGGRTMYTTALFDGGFMHAAAQKFAIDLPKNPSFFDPITKATGLDVPALGRLMMNKSNRITWKANDIMQTAAFMARIREGMSDVDARKSVERMIGAYRVDSSTFMGMRGPQKLLNTPAFAWFSFYHQDLWRAVGHTIAGLMPNADTQLRKEALGNLMVSAALMFGVYPALDDGVRKLTGNHEAEFGRRGLSTLQDAAYHGFVKGDKSIAKVGQNVWTPSIPANMAIEGFKNKDFTGKDIWSPGLSTGHNISKATDWAAKQLVPPYSQAAPAFRPGTNPLTEIPKRMAEASVGIKDPSPQAVKYEHNAPKRARAEEKRSYKRPGGLFEYLWTHK